MDTKASPNTENICIEKNKRAFYYEIVMAVLALIVAIILFIEFTRPLTEEQETLLTRIDLTILVIFAVDYFYRLIKAKDKWIFVKSNVFDLIAIMPFDKAFRLARLARLIRLLRFTKVLRIFAFMRRFGNTFSGVLKTNGLINMILITFVIVLLGAFGILAFESHMETFEDALWWSLVTTTTVGYGDISPETTGGRVLAGILMLVGIGFLGMVTGSIATYFVNRLNKSYDGAITDFETKQIALIKESLDNISYLSEEEIKAINKSIISVWENRVKE